MGDKGKETTSDSIRSARSRRSSTSSSSSSRSRSSSVSSSTSSDIITGDKPRKPPSPVEIPYVTILNRHLPPSIRVHAWSPVTANFSSRFSCIWRHYKYFFSTSPDASLIGTAKKFDFGAAYESAGFPDAARGWQERIRGLDSGSLRLDVKLMQNAVDRLVGEHDFRNFCKVDPPKQLTSHRRTVNSATIDPVEGEDQDTWVLNLRGGAFVSPLFRSSNRCQTLTLPPILAALQSSSTYRRDSLSRRSWTRAADNSRSTSMDFGSNRHDYRSKSTSRTFRRHESKTKLSDRRRPSSHPLAVRLQLD